MSTCTAQFTSIQTAIIMFIAFGEEDGERGSVFTPDLANLYIHIFKILIIDLFLGLLESISTWLV